MEKEIAEDAKEGETDPDFDARYMQFMTPSEILPHLFLVSDRLGRYQSAVFLSVLLRTFD